MDGVTHGKRRAVRALAGVSVLVWRGKRRYRCEGAEGEEVGGGAGKQKQQRQQEQRTPSTPVWRPRESERERHSARVRGGAERRSAKLHHVVDI